MVTPMINSLQLKQNPPPGAHHVRFRGDLLTVALNLAPEEKGRAWLRTNIGHGKTTKKENINAVDRAITPLAEDWFDIPMTRIDARNFRLTLPLHEPGRFEGKCYFLKKEAENPVWPEGGNMVLHVKTARTCSANIIYNAFVRQFGPNKERETVGDDLEHEWIEHLEERDYTVIPPSGKLRDLKKELDFIVGALGCRILLLLPIHPIPTTYARMGRFGSPYAALNFFSVDPGLASFDQYSTPLEQFIELVDGVHERGAMIMLDIAINHTGWAANLHETHPEWLARDSAGAIQAPGAWGVFWEDLTKLDYDHQGLWRYMTEVFLTWCGRGVDGFRCDAGYMIPLPAWRYIVARVRSQYPETVFLLEGLGGGIDATRDILDLANFDWAYSELFQNYDRDQIEHYLPGAVKLTEAEGGMIHFAETHDNPRLAARSVRYARMRTALCALFSTHGGFGFANGVEWYAKEKINVHQATSLNWGAEKNQAARIRDLTTLLKTHPVFFDRTELRLIQKGVGNHVVLLRHHLPTGKRVIVLANLDVEKGGLRAWDRRASGVESTRFRDLLNHEDVAIEVGDSGREASLFLEPGQVRCLSPDFRDATPRDADAGGRFTVPDRVNFQLLSAKVCEIFVYLHGVTDVGDLDMKEEVETLARDPREYCRGLSPFGEESRVALFRWPEDGKREVMIPPGYFLMVVAKHPFRARLLQWKRVLGSEEGLPGTDGARFALFVHRGAPKKHRRVSLELSVHAPGNSVHVQGRLLFLSHPRDAIVKTTFSRPYIANRNIMMLGVNGRGGMLSAYAEWGRLDSKYDALIAANLDPRRPEDRWIMLARCRVWLVLHDYSRELNLSCLKSFSIRDDSSGLWEYRIPTGRGQKVRLVASVRMIRGQNGIRMLFHRRPADGEAGMLEDSEKIRLVVRPDIEDRNFHQATKAYQGPESRWPGAVAATRDGFRFQPDSESGRGLVMRTFPGRFTEKHEWLYGIERPIDDDRGLDPASDLFSPGWFSANLEGGREIEIRAKVGEAEGAPLEKGETPWRFTPARGEWSIEEGMRKALDAYVVERAPYKSVIAGYPWFLDWGRDSFIFARGLVAAGRIEEAKSVVKLFAQYEENGTLPNESWITARSFWFRAPFGASRTAPSPFPWKPRGKVAFSRTPVAPTRADTREMKTRGGSPPTTTERPGPGCSPRFARPGRSRTARRANKPPSPCSPAPPV